MLVISRKPNESIVIGDRIVIEILEIGHNKIRLGIAAPDNIRIVRGELLAQLPLADHLERVRQDRDAGHESIEIELPVGAAAAAAMSEFNGQGHRSPATKSGAESSAGAGSSGAGSSGAGYAGADREAKGIGSQGFEAEEIGGETASSQLGGLVPPKEFGRAGYRAGHNEVYTSSRPRRYTASGRDGAISCEAARQAWQASSRSPRSTSSLPDCDYRTPRGNARAVSRDMSRAATGDMSRAATGMGYQRPSGYQQPSGYQRPSGYQQPTWAEMAWRRLEKMSPENHDELNEEAIAYQIVWQSWGSTAAPLGGSDPDSSLVNLPNCKSAGTR